MYLSPDIFFETISSTMTSFADLTGAVDQELQTALSAHDALGWLVQGHGRFKAGTPRNRNKAEMLEGALEDNSLTPQCLDALTAARH